MSDIISTLSNRCEAFSDRFGPIRAVGSPNITITFSVDAPLAISPNITAAFSVALDTGQFIYSPNITASFADLTDQIAISPNITATFSVRT